jgi:hypothetical protein
MAYTTVDEIVRNVLGDEGKVTTHEYLRHLHIANRGLKELTFDVLGDTKVVVLAVDNTLRVDLPGDYIDYVFIGVVNGDYRLETLGRDAAIPVDSDTNVNTEGSPEYHYIYGSLFGLGGGQNQNGYYAPKIDYENWQIILSSISAGQTIYLEYISDGRQEGGQNLVHPYAEEALVSYVYWKSIQRKRGIPANDKLMARKDWYNEKRLASARLKGFTKEEALQQIRKGFKQSPRA